MLLVNLQFTFLQERIYSGTRTRWKRLSRRPSLSSVPVLRRLTESSITTTEINL